MAYYSTISSQIYHVAGLVIKDGLRGVRHILLYLRSVGIRGISLFPAFLKRPSTSVVRRVDSLAEHVERRVAHVVHQYLDPAITRDSEMATFSKIAIRQDAPCLFAKTTYDNLKPALLYVRQRVELQEDFFISEMLSACAYRKAQVDVSANADDYKNGASVLIQLMQQGVIRTHKSRNAYRSSNPKIQKVAEIAYFAHMLWLLIARDYRAAYENHLLYACCDLSFVIHDQIRQAGHDTEHLARLLRTHVEIV